MTNGQNFKKGDIVRVKCTDIEDVVIDVLDNNVFLKNNGYWSVNVIELVEPTDRRTAFLRKLGALLREFDARIYDNDYYRVYIDLGIHDSLNPMERIVFTDTEGEITADNIMDFDKS